MIFAMWVLHFVIYAADPSKTLIWGDGIKKTTAGIFSYFSIQARDSTGKNYTQSMSGFTFTCLSDSKYTTDFCKTDPGFNEWDLSKGLYKIAYTATDLYLEYTGWEADYAYPSPLPDNYYSKSKNRIAVKVDGVSIPGSPFYIECFAYPVLDLKYSYAKGKDNVYKVGASQFFAMLDYCRDKYNNPIMPNRVMGSFTAITEVKEYFEFLSPYVKYPLPAPLISTTMFLNYYIKFDYECRTPGEVSYYIDYSGSELGSVIVPIKCFGASGATNKCTFVCHPGEVSKFVLTPLNETTLVVREYLYVRLDALDAYDYHTFLVKDYKSYAYQSMAEQTLNETLNITCSSSNMIVRSEFDIAVPGRVLVTIYSATKGVYNVTIKYKGKEIASSPLRVEYKNLMIDYNLSYVELSNINQNMPMNQFIGITFYLKNKYGNPVDAPLSTVSVTITPSTVPFALSKVVIGRYLVNVTNNAEFGKLVTIIIKYDGKLFLNSTLQYISGCTSDYTVYSYVLGSGTGTQILEQGQVGNGIDGERKDAGTMLNIKVIAVDTCKRTLTTGYPNFTIDSEFIENTVYFDATNNGDGRTIFTFNITKSDKFPMTIYTAEGAIMRKAILDIKPGPLAIQGITISGPGIIIAYADWWNEIYMTLHDIYGNTLAFKELPSGIRFVVTAKDIQFKSAAQSLSNPTMFVIKYMLSQGYSCRINILYDGVTLDDYPIDIYICPADRKICTNTKCTCTLDPSMTEVWGRGLTETVAGTDSYVYLRTKDSNGKIANWGASEVKVQCYSAVKYANDFCQQDPIITSNGNGLFTILYKSGPLFLEYNGWSIDGVWPEPLPDNYYTKTQNYLDIKVATWGIPGNRFLIKSIARPKVSNITSYAVSVYNTFRIGKENTFAMMDQIKDEFGNIMSPDHIEGYFSVKYSLMSEWGSITSRTKTPTINNPTIVSNVLNWYINFDFNCSYVGTISYKIYYTDKDNKESLIPIYCENMLSNGCGLKCAATEAIDLTTKVIGSKTVIITETAKLQAEAIDKFGYRTHFIATYNEHSYTLGKEQTLDGIFEAYSSNPNITVTYSLSTAETGRVYVNVTSKQSVGTFPIHFKFKGVEVDESPRYITFVADAPNLLTSYVNISNIPSIVSVGVPMTIDILLNDLYDNPTDVDTTRLQIDIVPVVSGSEPDRIIERLDIGHYQLILTKLLVHDIDVHVTIKYNNTFLKNGDISFRTGCLLEYSVYSYVTGTGTGKDILTDVTKAKGVDGGPLSAGKEQNIIVHAVDSCKRPINSGYPNFKLGTNFTYYTESLSQAQKGDGTTEFIFSLSKVGIYPMEVLTAEGRMVRQAILTVISGDVSPTTSLAYGTGLKRAYMNKWNKMIVALRDGFNNEAILKDAELHLDLNIATVDVAVSEFVYVPGVGYSAEYKLLAPGDCLITVTFDNEPIAGFPKEVLYCKESHTNCTETDECTCDCDQSTDECDEEIPVESTLIKESSFFSIFNWKIPEKVLKIVFIAIFSVVLVAVMLCILCCYRGHKCSCSGWVHFSSDEDEETSFVSSSASATSESGTESDDMDESQSDESDDTDLEHQSENAESQHLDNIT